jgi:hypothetical protein
MLQELPRQDSNVALSPVIPFTAQKTHSSPPREIRVRCQILRVINVDLQAQTFQSEVRFEASWLAPGLAEIAQRLKKNVTELSADEALSTNSEVFVVGDEEHTPLFAPRLWIRNVTEVHEQEKVRHSLSLC